MPFSLGVFLLVIFLFYCSTVLLATQLETLLNKYTASQEKPLSIFLSLSQLVIFLQTPRVKQISGYTAFLIALWNLFAPDFGSIQGGLTIIGALIPSIVLMIDSFILAPNLLEWIPIPDSLKEKVNMIIVQISPVAGVATLLTTVIHALFYPFPFF